MGRIDAAVNCAGIGAPARLVGKQGAMAGAFFRKMIEINLVGTVLISKAAAVAMQRNAPNAAGERGVIVMTASVAAFDGQIGQVAYAASKGGIVAMTLPMARELASSGIRVMTIAPGLFATPMLKALPQEAQDSLGRQTPFPPRLGEPDEYAAMVEHIIENTMLNGETIRLDGAIRMQPRLAAQTGPSPRSADHSRPPRWRPSENPSACTYRGVPAGGTHRNAHTDLSER